MQLDVLCTSFPQKSKTKCEVQKNEYVVLKPPLLLLSLNPNLFLHFFLLCDDELFESRKKEKETIDTEMMFGIVLASLLATSLAYNGLKATNVRSSALMAKSKALPFLEAPAKLDGSTVGDFGFDPLGFTNTVPNLHYVSLKSGILDF